MGKGVIATCAKSAMLVLAVTCLAWSATTLPASAAHATPRSFLAGLHRVSTLASTIPSNGDENPYAVYVAPYSVGSIRSGDVFVDDFNAVSNEQGTGTSVLLVTPTGHVTTFATLPRHLAACPGGIGLTTAMTELSSGWVLVGSAPTRTGTTATAGRGCLIVLSATGRVAGAIASPEIDGPWDMATVENGAGVTVLLTNTLVGVKAPTKHAIRQGTLVRLTLSATSSAPPVLRGATVIASGLPERAEYESRLVVGPTGVAVEGGTAYVSDPLDNAIIEIPHALTRTSSAGSGTKLTSGGALHGPLAMAVAPNGDLLVSNGLNGDIVEITRSGKQIAHVALDPDPAQSPPGNGDLFGLAVAPSGKSLYFAKDDTNTLAVLS